MFTFFAVSALAASLSGLPSPYYAVSGEKQVPADLLYAISMQESQLRTNKGRTIPWPWTVNYKGKGYRFNSREEMHAFCRELEQKGIRLFDIGIAQVNWRWHSTRFSGNLWQATDPHINLSIAATILKEQYESTGNWWLATGKYHHPSNSVLARRYQQSVFKKWKSLSTK